MNGRIPAEFYFDDGDVLSGVYSSTLNVMRAILSPDPDVPLLWADLAHEQSLEQKSTVVYEAVEDALLSCSHLHEHVVAFLLYRGSMAWHGRACRSCLLFFGPYYPHELAAEMLLDIKSVRPLSRLTPPS
ncbi:hypothetical protein EPN42_05975 [bacterium]|nr:MAG: hypothetical protein EPN42_05975 [bacterium]